MEDNLEPRLPMGYGKLDLMVLDLIVTLDIKRYMKGDFVSKKMVHFRCLHKTSLKIVSFPVENAMTRNRYRMLRTLQIRLSLSKMTFIKNSEYQWESRN